LLELVGERTAARRPSVEAAPHVFVARSMKAEEAEVAAQAVKVAMVLLEPFLFTTNMWAVIENGYVVNYIVGIPYEEALIKAEKSQLVEMTLENSPAYIGGKYLDGKFFPKEN
jgi:hypothetical protein